MYTNSDHFRWIAISFSVVNIFWAGLTGQKQLSSRNGNEIEFVLPIAVGQQTNMAPKKLSFCFDYLVLRPQLSDVIHVLYWSTTCPFLNNYNIFQILRNYIPAILKEKTLKLGQDQLFRATGPT